MRFEHAFSRGGGMIPWHRKHADESATRAQGHRLPHAAADDGGRGQRRFPPGRERAARALALFSVIGLLGLTGVVAGAALPAAASSFTLDFLSGPSTQAVGQATHLLAASNQTVSGTQFSFDIFDVTTGALVQTCGGGPNDDCNVFFTENVATTQVFVAYIADFGNTNPPPEIQATSEPVYVTWTQNGYQLTLNPSSSGGVIATANVSLGTTPYYIEIFDETRGTLLTPEFTCGALPTCSVSFSERRGARDWLIAFITVPNLYPPVLSGIQASSNVLET
jgi:hypothetical protein